MKIRTRTCEPYSVEIRQNALFAAFINTDTGDVNQFELSERRFELDQLILHLYDKSKIFIGYGNHAYEDICMRGIATTCYKSKRSEKQLLTSIYNLSECIKEGRAIERFEHWKTGSPIESVDLLLHVSRRLRMPLRAKQIEMQHEYIPDAFEGRSEPVKGTDVDATAQAVLNNALSIATMLEKAKDQLKLRTDIEDIYHTKALSSDGISIGMKLLLRAYLKGTGKRWNDIKDLKSPMDFISLKNVILPIVGYETKPLKDLLAMMKTKTIPTGKKGFEHKLLIDDTGYTIGVGGMHSITEPEAILPAEDEMLLHCDIKSAYASLTIAYKIYPQHLGPEYLDVYLNIKQEREKAKEDGNKIKDEIMKLALVGPSGNLRNPFSWIYSPECAMKICINTQLLLLMLIERLIAIKARIVQANTDGLFLVIKKASLNEYKQICKEWEDKTKVSLDHTEYASLHQLTVNDYFAVATNNQEVKEAGIFNTKKGPTKGRDAGIVTKAVKDYFLYEIPIEKSVQECTDIRMFIMTETAEKEYITIYNSLEINNTNRFYATPKGYYLYKAYTRAKKNLIPVVNNAGVLLANDLTVKVIPSNINHGYYIRKAKAIKAKFLRKQLSLF